jgi:hypothetical protein
MPRHLAVVLGLILATGIARGQEPKSVVPPHGIQAFLNLLDVQQFEPVTELANLARLDPTEVLIIVFGDNQILDDIRNTIGDLNDFTDRGGAVLIASDRDDAGRLREWKIQIDGTPILDVGSAYRNLPACPLIVPQSNHPLFSGLRLGIATNMPSYVQVRQSDLQVLAGFSENGMTPDGRRELAFMVGTVGMSRFLVLAGHSVFWNLLIAQRDNDNGLFARNCVQWLSESSKGRRRKYAFMVEEGRIVTDFNVGLTVAMQDVVPPIQVINHLLRGWEDENFFNRLLQRFMSANRIYRGLVVFFSLLLLAYSARRILRARWQRDLAVPLAAMNPFPPVISVSLTERRRKALAKSGNCWEPAHTLARFFFEQWISSPGGPQVKKLRCRFHGIWLRRRVLARQVDELWNIAYSKPGSVSVKQFLALPAILDHLSHLANAGQIELYHE